MVTELCTAKFEEYERLIRYHGTFMLFFCVLNFAFSLVATLGNLLVIRALWKASSMPETLKKLFLNLAVSDLAVGSIAQLMLGVIIAVMLKEETSGGHAFNILCPTIITLFLFLLLTLASASFFTITVIALDRFLAISLHLRYEQLVTSKRVIFVLICVWLASVTVGSIFISMPYFNLMMIVIVELYGLLVTTVIYIYIYRIARYHKNRILSQFQLQNDHAMEVLREKKSAISALLVYIVLMVCYIPNSCCTILLLVDRSQISFLVANRVSLFLVLLNSSLNPLIYCWRYRELREIVKKMIWK